jgi:hypothetical protein
VAASVDVSLLSGLYPTLMSDYKADARAAFMGLIFGAIVLFGIMYTIVHLTNAKYAGHSEAAAPQH